MSDKYFKRQRQIASVSSMIKDTLINSQIDGAGLIANANDRVDSIVNAALVSPLFEGIAENRDAVTAIATSWGSSLKDYVDMHGHAPRADLLASCGESLMALTNGGEESSKMMFESLGGKANFSTSEGISIRSKTAALIMPVALAATTNDAATFVQGGRDEVECFEIHRVSNTAFGDVAKGQVLDESFHSQFSGMKQAYILPTATDATKERFVVYIYNEAAPAEDLTALVSVLANHNPQGCGFEPRSLVLRVGGQAVASSLQNGSLFGQFSYKGVSYSVVPDTDTHDKDKGVIGFKVSPALPANTPMIIQYDVNIEAGSANSAFPEINHTMSSFKLIPHQSVLAAQHSIQSYWALSREYGLDVRSLQASTMRNSMAYEKDIRNLRDMIIAASANPTVTIPLAVTEGAYFKEKYEELHEHLLLLSNVMMTETKVSGLVGIYAGIGASTVFKALGAPFFTPAPNYRQVPRVHFCGLLFGKWKVFECPNEIEIAGQKLGRNDAIGYARGDEFSQAGLIAGDAVSPTVYKHGTDARMFNRDTLWELSYGDISPRGGEKFFHKFTITK